MRYVPLVRYVESSRMMERLAPDYPNSPSSTAYSKNETETEPRGQTRGRSHVRDDDPRVLPSPETRALDYNGSF